MISCTEFIPAYSELFKYIDQKSGRQAVYDYWDRIFQPTEDNALNKILAEQGLRGCWHHWYKVNTEEACDNTMFYNEAEGWWGGCMHSCPSKGRFDKLGYMTPFDEYCKHCNGYDWSLNKHGLLHIMDYRGEEHACCREIIYDPKVYQGDPQEQIEIMYRCEMEGCKFDEDPSKCPVNHPGTMTLRTSPKNLKYLHRDFHTGVAGGTDFVLETYGMDGVKEYLSQFVAAFHLPLIADIKEKGLAPLAEYLTGLYAGEEASDALEMAVTENEVMVTIHYCPGVRYMKSIGVTPKESYVYCTSITYEALAEQSGIGFEMISYDHDTGAAQYRFFTK